MAKSESGMNIIQMKINDMVDLMTPLYAASKPKEVPSLMLWGPPGIGKSESIKAIAKKLETMTGKKVVVTDVRLLLFNPVDLRGIPVADAKRELAVWLKPKIFQMDPSDNIINILMLDEISAAPQSVQAAAYQITLDRIIGEHKLPDNCIVMAAGNRVTDKSVAYKMPKALGNRMTHLEMICDIEDWKKWAIPYGIDSRIVGYLNYMSSHLFKFDPSNDDCAYPTPRSWKMVNDYLSKLNSIEVAFPLIAGSIGLGCATEFKAWTQVFHKLPDVKGILAGTVTEVPKEPDVLYALSAALVSAIGRETGAAQKKALSNILTYSMNMPAEFSTLTVKDMVMVEDLRQKILTLGEWITWSRKHKNFIM